MSDNEKTRRHAVFLRLNDAENGGLEFLQQRECLPKAQVIRRLLIREVRASQPAGEPALEKKTATSLFRMRTQPTEGNEDAKL